MNAKFPTFKTVKPDGTEYIRRVYSPAAGLYELAMGIIVPFCLEHSGQPLETDTRSVWNYVTEALGPGGLLDEGYPKQQGELLAAGHCYPPRGFSTQPVSASISAGSIHKRLAVYGDRQYGLAAQASDPTPFSSMPLTFERALGGPDHLANPLGMGLDRAAGSALPNVEHPGQLLTTRGDLVEPASFMPLPSGFAQRRRFLGNFEGEWLADRWPHLPDGTDPRFFQTAPSDQQLEGYWQGGENIVVLNMHPLHSELHGQVPRIRPRFFAYRMMQDDQAEFVELTVQADTLWLLPGHGVGLMVYRSVIPARHADAQDIYAFMAAFENPQEPALDIEHYIRQCLHALAPESSTNQQENQAQFEQLSQLSSPELLRVLREQKAQFERMLAENKIDEAALQQQLLSNPHTRRFAQELTGLGGTLSEFFGQIESFLHSFNAQEPPVKQNDSDLVQLGKALAATVQTASEAPTAAPVIQHAETLQDIGVATRNRNAILQRIAQGQSCQGLDLSQANLAGVDLSGVDFSDAVLAGANLRGAKLVGACLRHANLQGASLEAADLAGCELVGATLDQACLVGAQLQGANLDHSDCSQANFAGANLRGARLHQANLSYAWLQRVNAAQIQAEGTDFSHANLEGAQLQHAYLDRANFSGARMQQSVLDQSSCVLANFTLTDLSHTSLVRCDLSASQTSVGTLAPGADLTQAILNEASWIGMNLEGASMADIKGLQADFSDANLRHTRITRADLRQAIFDRADLSYAQLNQSNLMEASFAQADLGFCQLSETNLYAATFMDTRINQANFQGANIGATLLAARASS